MKGFKRMWGSGRKGSQVDLDDQPVAAGRRPDKNSRSTESAGGGLGRRGPPARRANVPEGSAAHEASAAIEAEEAAAAVAAEAAWLADNFRQGVAAGGKHRRRSGKQGAHGTSSSVPLDPDIPAWCMQDASLRDDDGDDAHAQPGARRSPCGDDASPPRDAERECVICQEEKPGPWQALPCAHVFHAACVHAWFSQKPSCPVCRMVFPTLQAGHTSAAQGTTWLGSTAVTRSDSNVVARYQLEQLMDPNILARVAMPRAITNFLDNLPSEERLASDGPSTLVEPTKKTIICMYVCMCICMYVCK